MNPGKGVERINMEFRGNKYDTKFTRTGKKRKYFMHYMHKLALDVTFTVEIQGGYQEEWIDIGSRHV